MQFFYPTSTGVHTRELKGLEKFKAKLPNHYYGFANLELIEPQKKIGRQIDIVLITEDRIILVDIKDWHGTITSENSKWYQNGIQRGISPVNKIADNARLVADKLKAHLKRFKGTSRYSAPMIHSAVVMTGTADYSGLDEGQKSRIFKIDKFCQILSSTRSMNENLGRVYGRVNLFDKNLGWKEVLKQFFTNTSAEFKAQDKLFDGHKITSDAIFSHATGTFKEFESENIEDGSSALIRNWDFSRGSIEFTDESQRVKIAGREQKILTQLNEISADSERVVLRPKTQEAEKTLDYWEIFAKRRELRKLSEFIYSDILSYSVSKKFSFLETLIANLAVIHRADIAHNDVGKFSIWASGTEDVRFSNFILGTGNLTNVSDKNQEFLRTLDYDFPENLLGEVSAKFKKDVYSLGVLFAQILFPEHLIVGEDKIIQLEPKDQTLKSEQSLFWDFTEKLLEIDPQNRPNDANEVLEEFISLQKTIEQKQSPLNSLIKRYSKWENSFFFQSKFPIAKSIVSTAEQISYLSEIGEKTYKINLIKVSTDNERFLCDLILKIENLEKYSLKYFSLLEDFGFVDGYWALITNELPKHSVLDRLKKSENLDAAIENFSIQILSTLQELHGLGIYGLKIGLDDIWYDSSSNLQFNLPFDLENLSDQEPIIFSHSVNDTINLLTSIARIFDTFKVTGIRKDKLHKIISTLENGQINEGLLDLVIDIFKEPDQPKAKVINLQIPALNKKIVMSADFENLPVTLKGKPKREVEIKIFSATGRLRIIYNISDQAVVFSDFAKITARELEVAERHSDATISKSIELTASSQKQNPSILKFLRDEGLLALVEKHKLELKEKNKKRYDPKDHHDARQIMDEKSTNATTKSVPVGIAELWQSAIDAETEIFSMGLVSSNSYYSDTNNRLNFIYEPIGKELEFSDGDIIQIQVSTKSDDWFVIGNLDTQLSRPPQIVVQTRAERRDFRLRDGDKIRFYDVLAQESLDRRRNATERILANRSPIKNLADVFDQNKKHKSAEEKRDLIGFENIESYDLNKDQKAALKKFLETGPVSFLQGPPGTGKTKFISTLIHFGISHNLFKKVLIASQSHEAVNNAAESLIELFKRQRLDVSMIRVGTAAIIPDSLKPYHTSTIEHNFRTQFKNRMLQNYRFCAAKSGLSPKFARQFYDFHTTIFPLIRSYRSTVDENTEKANRLQQVLETKLLSFPHLMDVNINLTDEELLIECITKIAEKTGFVSESSIKNFSKFLKLSDDWIGQVSSRVRNFEEFLANTRSIVCGTCVGLGKSSLSLFDQPFDIVIIDEAARCTPGELSIPLQSAKKVILVGDQNQLEPFFDDELLTKIAAKLQAEPHQITTSSFEHGISKTDNAASIHRLTEQYRMMPSIGELVSQTFYEPTTKLSHGRQSYILPRDCLPHELKSQLIWYDTTHGGEKATETYERHSKSLKNEYEAKIVTDIIGSLTQNEHFLSWFRRCKDEYPIGIIAGYAAQKRLITEKLISVGTENSILSRIKVDTIDSYQGQENVIIILSLVRNNQASKAGQISPGFMAKPNRINVAISRARDNLIIVGAKSNWQKGSAIEKLASNFDKLDNNKIYDA